MIPLLLGLAPIQLASKPTAGFDARIELKTDPDELVDRVDASRER